MRKTCAIIAMAGCISLLTPVHANAGTSRDDLARGSFRKINDERAARGLSKLSWSDSLASVARRHSHRMADQQQLHHNSNLPSEVSGWSRLGENVGVGWSVQQIHDALMASPSHRDNILGRYERAGVAVVVDDEDRLWLTQVFMTPQRSTATTSKPKRSATTARAPAPRPSPSQTPRRKTSASSPPRHPATASPPARAEETSAAPAVRPSPKPSGPVAPQAEGQLRYYRTIGSYTPFSRG